MSASGQDPETYPAVTLPKSDAVEQIEAVTELVRIVAETTAERDRYRAALESIALGPTMCGCAEVPVIASEALNPVMAAKAAALSELLAADAAVDDPRIDRAEDERRDPDPDDAPRGWEPQ